MTKYQIKNQQGKEKNSNENRRVPKHERIITNLLEGLEYSTEK